jgi:pimeloyl-ACP methyl ester carboxylesterase
MTTAEKAEASTIELHDGRRLAFAEYGDAAGAPVFFMHGFTASRITRHPDDQLTESLGVRLLTLDRPGCGASDLRPGRTLLDVGDDVRQLADALGVVRFAVLGHSAGGPYALACGRALPDRVAAVGVVCGFAPMDRPGAADGMRPDMAGAMATVRRMPWLARPFASSLSRQFKPIRPRHSRRSSAPGSRTPTAENWNAPRCARSSSVLRWREPAAARAASRARCS